MIRSVKDRVRRTLLFLQEYTGTDNIYIAKSGFWSMVPFVISTLLSAGLLVAFGRYVPKETYGTYKYILSVAGSIGFLTLTGMNTAVTRMAARGIRGALAWSVRFQLRWNVLYTAAAALLAIYYGWHNNQMLAIGLMILGLAFPLQAALNTYGAYLSGIKDFRRAARYGIGGTIFSAGALFIAIITTHSTIPLVLAYAIGNLLPTAYFYWRTLRTVDARELSSDEQAELTSFGWHFSFVNVLSTIDQYLDKIIIFQHIGAVQLAVYAIAQALPERVNGLFKSGSSIFLPKLAERSVGDIRRVFYIRTMQGMLLGALATAAYWLAAPWLFRVFLPKYLDSIRYSQVMSLGLIFSLPAAYTGSIFRAQGMVRTMYLSSIGGHGLMIALFLTLGIPFGIWGLIAANLITLVSGTIYNFILWELQLRRHPLQ